MFICIWVKKHAVCRMFYTDVSNKLKTQCMLCLGIKYATHIRKYSFVIHIFFIPMVWHDGAVVTTLASQCEGPGFNPQIIVGPLWDGVSLSWEGFTLRLG